MSTLAAEKDPLHTSQFRFDNLESQVNNVVSGKAPSSIDFNKLIRKPWVYGTALFIVFLLIIWFWSPGFIKDDEGHNKTWLLLGIPFVLAAVSSGLLWFFVFREKSPSSSS